MRRNRISLFVLVTLVCSCSQGINVTQPPQKLSKLIVSDSIDFGIDPLWREADTTVTIKLSKDTSITAIVITDSNFTLLDTSRENDTLHITLRFQPQSLANHGGQCLLLSKRDTLARLTLLGKTSAFERHVGDAYILSTTHGLDTIRVVGLPGTLSCSRQDFFEAYLDGATTTVDGNLLFGIDRGPSSSPACFDSVLLTVGDCRHISWMCQVPGVRSFYYQRSYSCGCSGDTVTVVRSVTLPIVRVYTADDIHDTWQGANYINYLNLIANYSRDIQFFTQCDGYTGDGPPVHAILVGFIPGP